MFTIPITETLLTGAAELEVTERGFRPHRLPRDVLRRFPDPQLTAMEAQPSGVTIAFRTSATDVELVSHPMRATYAGAERPRGRIDLVVDGSMVATDELTQGDAFELDLRDGTSTFHPGVPHISAFRGLPSGDKEIEIWLPHNESLELISISVNAPVSPSEKPDARVWVHYGSSISQGSNAAGPTGIWPAIAARAGGLRLRNLGFGGSALLDPFIARVIRDAPADFISLKIGINIVNLDSMRLRAFVPALHGFLDTIRDGHPYTPIVVISPIFCGIHENTPGPGSVDVATLGTDQVRFLASGDVDDTRFGRLTLAVIREAMAAAIAGRCEPNMAYLDGLDLYGPGDADEFPLPDALHPDTRTHHLIGERFTRSVVAGWTARPYEYR
ncbi:lipase [Subtercola boreus]|uniref:Lipase n=2 Tax=Subtercola boreus TaxID=120213 RepID=A0A3E0VE41_9MICO|nr:SGNH/GDSL hydrolase family protein [Subtercola boreus]RFA07137.1 lipase [Subtercola boreus]